VARLMKLGYPGGPEIDRLAAIGNPEAFTLPEGRISLPEGGYHRYDASFSGLKTAMMRLIKSLEISCAETEMPIADLAASFQYTVAKALTKRSIACALDHGLSTIVVGGGVLFPSLEYCTDNAAMIACAAAEHFDRGHRSSLRLGAQSRMPISQVMDLYV